jgi:hypothetical protein
MHRKITDRFPFLRLVESEGGDGGDGGSGGGAGEASKFAPIDSQEAFDAAIKDRIGRVKAGYADYDEIKAKAAEHDALIESQKSENQKAIDAALKERDDIASEFEAHKRKSALDKIPEDKRATFDGKSAAEIESAIALAAALAPAEGQEQQNGKQPPAQRGQEHFVSGAGHRQAADPDMESLVKDLF